MILFGIFIYRCIKQFPILLVLIFCTAALSPRVFIEQETLEETVELETEVMLFKKVLAQNSHIRTYHTNKQPTVDEEFISDAICSTKKEFLLNYSLTYYC